MPGWGHAGIIMLLMYTARPMILIFPARPHRVGRKRSQGNGPSTKVRGRGRAIDCTSTQSEGLSRQMDEAQNP